MERCSTPHTVSSEKPVRTPAWIRIGLLTLHPRGVHASSGPLRPLVPSSPISSSDESERRNPLVPPLQAPPGFPAQSSRFPPMVRSLQFRKESSGARRENRSTLSFGSGWNRVPLVPCQVRRWGWMNPHGPWSQSMPFHPLRFLKESVGRLEETIRTND